MNGLESDMPSEHEPLPADVVDLLQQDRVVEAIKRLRETTGLGLKEAKDAVDAYRTQRTTPGTRSASIDPLPPDVLAAMERGQKIEAIRLLRDRTGMGLKEAKEAVEASRVGAASGSITGSNGLGRFVLFALVLAAGAIVYTLVSGRG
jgi:ribosomal protein L7/L12